MEKTKVRAVHEQDLDEFLRSIGMPEQLERGELRCGEMGKNAECNY